MTKTKPFDPYELADPEEVLATEEPEPPFRTTDLWNCEVMVRKWGSKFRYVHDWGRFLIWSGKRWEPDNTGKIYRYARDTVRHIYKLASEELDNNGRKALAKHALRSENRQKLQNMVELTKSEWEIPITPAQLDKGPFLFNCLNGTIDLKIGKLREHNWTDYLTKIAPVDYDPEAECPLWLSFLNHVMDGNQHLITFLKRAIGYSLAGDTREQCFFFLHGNGCNGKSTFLEVVKALTGDYGTQARPEIFLLKQDNSVPNEIASLRGKRFVATIEIGNGRQVAESLVKQLTGQDTVSARFLYHEFFEYHPEFKLWLAANHKPVIRGTDYAIWRRVKLIPFNVKIPEGEQDKTLIEKLKIELPGILKWAVEGCLQWQEKGLQPPEEVLQATEQYRDEMDVLAPFLDDCCIIDKTKQCSVKQFYNSYLQWCDRNGEKSESKKSIGTRMRERGFDQYKDGNGMMNWIGVGITENTENTD